MHERIYAALEVLGLLVVASAIALLHWPLAFAGIFLIVSGEVADQVRARLTKGRDE